MKILPFGLIVRGVGGLIDANEWKENRFRWL